MDCQDNYEASKNIMESPKMPKQKVEQKHPLVKFYNKKPQDVVDGEHTEICKGMLTFYLRQLNPYSCSVASVSIVLNTILARMNKTHMSIPIDQEQLLLKVPTANWKEKVSIPGFQGKHGLSIQELGMVVKATLKAFEIPYKKINTIPIHERLKNLKKEKSLLFSLLMKFCKEKNHYIIAHFTQGVYTGDWFGGHISPVGSFDPENRRVLILDVDEHIDAPYWVSFDIFFEGLVGKTKTIGPKEGGYVSISI
jgi:hypothetical protein